MTCYAIQCLYEIEQIFDKIMLLSETENVPPMGLQLHGAKNKDVSRETWNGISWKYAKHFFRGDIYYTSIIKVLCLSFCI